jgi:sterol desaturase/sphingolipid hydroxylase (fatty acid hydroxylase superfamily)
MWNWITTSFAALHSWVFETLVQPTLYQMGFMNWDERAYEGTELFLIGAIELILLFAIFRPIEMLAPVEKWDDRKPTRVDVVYSILAKLGILPLFFFAVLTPAFDWINGNLRMNGIIPPNLEDLVPALKDSPVLSAAIYLAVFDFMDYWRHRMQHRFGIWWALHSLHHSQRQMTFWTDDREHLLDQFITAAWRASIGLFIGVPPVQFLTVTLVSGAIESFSHANVRVNFNLLGLKYLIVSPQFHRVHHAMAVGHDGPARGCNFAQVFPLWDLLFRTANYDPRYLATGVSDQAEGRDYGVGFWSQQWFGLKRMWDPQAGAGRQAG